MASKSKIALRGADKFILALEHHDRHHGTSGNTCRYVLELEGNFEAAALTDILQKNELARWMSRFQLAGRMRNSNYWKSRDEVEIPVTVLQSDELLPKELLETKQSRYDTPLFYFHIIQRSNGNSTIIFSWHHLLMDGYGASLFLKNLSKPLRIQASTTERSPISWKTFVEMRRSKRYISKSAKGKITALESSFQKAVEQGVRVLTFSEEETSALEEQQKIQGAKFGQGVFLLTCVTRAVNRHVKQEQNSDFWIPIPQDSRKKGSSWPVLGNHLSFLFYRIDTKLLHDKKATIQSLNAQMMDQVKRGIPKAYGHLMNCLRWIPSPLYTRLIKGPNGKSLSSFLFTTAAEHPTDLDSFFGRKITNALSIPPNTYPPGLTFAVNHFNSRLQIVVLYYTHLFSEKDMDSLLKNLRLDLLDQME